MQLMKNYWINKKLTMENDKQLIREFLESFASILDNVATISRQNNVFIDEIHELRVNLEHTKEKIAFDIHNSSQYLPDGHFYFEENELKHLKERLYICPNYLWTFNEVNRHWIKLSRVFARKCDITGEGMNEGYYIECNLMYIKTLDDMKNHIKNDTDYKDLKEAYDDEYYYYTNWEDPLDYQYKSENNKLVEL